MTAVLILGNQLFDPKIFARRGPSLHFFMREDRELCTHFKYHKHKIMFFLSAMRKYAQELQSQGLRVHYEKLGQNPQPFEDAFVAFLKSKNISQVEMFEIEDKFFETRIISILRDNNISLKFHKSPMFLTSRESFSQYLSGQKRPFMKTFYEKQRKNLKLLVDENGAPLGGQWSFDTENRRPLAKGYTPPSIPPYEMDSVDREIASLVEKEFSSHIGDCENFWLPTDRQGASEWLENFLEYRLENFGVYEDALSPVHPFINHSVLTPYLNCGLLTPHQVINTTLKKAAEKNIPLNSLEGFLRQIVGWREFIRGIYQNYSERQESLNFWNHQRPLNHLWYTGETGIPPLDDVIKKTVRYGYAHHIERLMVVSSLMLLLEIHPHEAHRWFMEMFIDSSDWVMGPNVYGMGLFSDGGIFATKPYFCGSNYYRKMGPYKAGDWQIGVDGLYWSFIDKHQDFFSKNPRMSMMVKTVNKMPAEKKEMLFKAAQTLKQRL